MVEGEFLEIEVNPKQKKILKKLVKEFGGWMEDNEEARFPSAFHLREFLKSIDDKVKSGELK